MPQCTSAEVGLLKARFGWWRLRLLRLASAEAGLLRAGFDRRQTSKMSWRRWRKVRLVSVCGRLATQGTLPRRAPVWHSSVPMVESGTPRASQSRMIQHGCCV